MPRIPEMCYEVKSNSIEVKLPLISQGKFRFKKRDNIQDFGNGFAPKKNIISKDAYLEWQIGYDTIIGKDEKDTKLKDSNFVFVGANKKLKHPYELSEIAFFMCKLGIISKDEISSIYEKIDDMDDYLQERYSIEVKKEKPITINGVDFLSSSTKLPTFILEDKDSKLLVEIMIQKQQYATGVQPMLYLDIPANIFTNNKSVVGYTSSETPYGIISFDNTFKNVVFKLLLCFGMCSRSHNHDVKEIIKIIINNAY